MILRDEAHPLDAVEEALAKEVDSILHRHYPEHPWMVSVDKRTGCLDVFNFSLSEKNGFRLHLTRVKNHSDIETAVMRAGGEFLERFGVPRKRADQDQVAALSLQSWGR